MIDIRGDCTHCKVEGSVLDSDDGSSHCLLCRRVTSEDAEQSQGIAIDDGEALLDSLALWAQREGYSVEEFLETNFLIAGADALVRAIAKGESTETSFDLNGLLFGSGGGSGGGSYGTDERELGPDPTLLVMPERAQPASRIALPAPVPYSPKNAVLALASVMAADGEHAASEWHYVSSFANGRSVPFHEHDVRVYRPDEVGDCGNLKERELLVEHMVELAMIDGESDESEMRVIEAFTRSFGVDPLRVTRALARYGGRHENIFRRVLRRVATFLFPAPA